MCTGLAVLLCACSAGTSQGSGDGSSNVLKEECLDDIQAGLQARFEMMDNDANSVAESQKQLKDAINEELSYVEKYTRDSFDSDESFDDEQFENTVLAYVEALENQKRGVKYWRSNAAKYERLYNQKGYDAWSKALNSLVDQYGLTVENQYQDDLDNALSDNRYQNIRIGDTVDVSTENGNISVSIEGMEWTDWKELAQEDGDYEMLF